MEFDETKKLEVEVTQNQFVETRTRGKRRNPFKGALDAFDIAIIPVAIGVFVSLGFLFANIFKATSIVDAVSNISRRTPFI